MRVESDLLQKIIEDLGLNRVFVRGQTSPVNNCWHFSSDGNAVDALFRDDDDFAAGMNRIYVVSKQYRIVILAFALMDTHVHFVVYGDFSECNLFIHEYARRTSMYISTKYKDRKKLDQVPINHQPVENDLYLKTVICYVVKNPPVAGIQHMAWNYPWSSGCLYFCNHKYWTSPYWKRQNVFKELKNITKTDYRELLKTRDEYLPKDLKILDNLIFPGEYVAYEIVEQLYRTCKSFNYFLCVSREEDVEARGGNISHLSIPMQEMRQHKNTVCMEMYGVETVKTLSTVQRMRLAKELRKRYNSSSKQIARLCGLVYEEVKNLI